MAWWMTERFWLLIHRRSGRSGQVAAQGGEGGRGFGDWLIVEIVAEKDQVAPPAVLDVVAVRRSRGARADK